MRPLILYLIFCSSVTFAEPKPYTDSELVEIDNSLLRQNNANAQLQTLRKNNLPSAEFRSAVMILTPLMATAGAGGLAWAGVGMTAGLGVTSLLAAAGVAQYAEDAYRVAYADLDRIPWPSLRDSLKEHRENRNNAFSLYRHTKRATSICAQAYGEVLLPKAIAEYAAAATSVSITGALMHYWHGEYLNKELAPMINSLNPLHPRIVERPSN